MAFFTSGDTELYFEVAGSGRKLLFLNGTGATVDNLRPIIAMLAEHFEVAAYDQRGLGRTTFSDAPYTMADLAGDALALTDHLGWTRFRVVGLSFGGMVAQEVAVSAPERLDRLALLCTSSGGRGGSSYPLQNLATMEPEERAAASALLLDTRFTDEWLAAHDDDRALATLLTQHFTADKPEPVRKAEALQLQARAGHDVYERLPRISCPTLVAVGRYDGIAPVANGAAIVSQLPDGQLEAFDGGHVFFAQDPRAFPRIIEFLAGR